ncbi:MAG TPA: hypothetical protein VFX30_14820 [bacterium]|nr:hypothetical protein [bacterium]
MPPCLPMTYPQNFVSRFAPMADGRMAVPAVHVPPYLSWMHQPGRIPEASAVIGGPDTRAAFDLKTMAENLLTQPTISALLEDGQAVPALEGRGLQWMRGNGSLFWSSLGVGHRLVCAKDLESKAFVTFNQHGPPLSVEVGKITDAGRCRQDNTIDAGGRVSTECFEFEAFYGEDRGARLPYFSGWHFMAGGMACFSEASFLVDLMELALMVKGDQGPLSVSLELTGGDDEVDLGIWDFPEADQTIALAGFSPVEHALIKASRLIAGDPFLKIYFNLHRREDPERGGGKHALPVSVDGIVSREALLVGFHNTSKRGLMRLPAALEPALTAFFPKSGQ